MTSGARPGPSGMLIVAPGDRDAVVAASGAAVAQTREAPVTADTLDPQRVDVSERWELEAALLAFRGAGPSGATAARILDADVRYVEAA
jgi:hypothetical protein